MTKRDGSSVTIERDEFKTTKARREAGARGRYLLAQVVRYCTFRKTVRVVVAFLLLILAACPKTKAFRDNDGVPRGALDGEPRHPTDISPTT